MNKGFRELMKDPEVIAMSQPFHISLKEALAEGERMSKIDNTKAHPMMKQQYTYKDLEAAFKAGVEVDSRKMVNPILRFESWVKKHKFEMLDGKL